MAMSENLLTNSGRLPDLGHYKQNSDLFKTRTQINACAYFKTAEEIFQRFIEPMHLFLFGINLSLLKLK